MIKAQIIVEAFRFYLARLSANAVLSHFKSYKNNFCNMILQMIFWYVRIEKDLFCIFVVSI